MPAMTPPLRDRLCDLCGISLQVTGTCLLVPIVTRWHAPGLALHRVYETWCGMCASAKHATRPRPTAVEEEPHGS